MTRRALVLWAVEFRAEGIPDEEVHGLIEQQDLWDSVSPHEKAFLENENPNADECQEFVWRLESIWVLMWALGYIKRLDWPSGMCDVTKLAELIAPFEADPAFITSATLRPVSKILDAQDLILRIHWAIRDAMLHQGGTLPEDLDWSTDEEFVPGPLCAAVGVVQQRHHTLNWLVNFCNPKDWDELTTHT